MGLFDKAKNVYSIQKQAKAIKNELKKIHIEAESDGMKITMSGEQDFIECALTDELWTELTSSPYGKKKLGELFVKVAQKAVKKAQEIGSAKMKNIWGQLGG